MYVFGIILFKFYFTFLIIGGGGGVLYIIFKNFKLIKLGCYILYMFKEDDKKLNIDFNGNSSRLKYFKVCLNINIE